MERNEKLTGILRHIKRVEDNCNLLAQKLETEDEKFSRALIQRGRLHDASKLNEFEFRHLNSESKLFKAALEIHHINNSHHPEYYEIKQKSWYKSWIKDPSNKPEEFILEKGIFLMSELDIAEMVCDCLARSQEFGSDINEWFFELALQKYEYKEGDKVWNSIKKYLSLLLTPKFTKVRTLHEVPEEKLEPLNEGVEKKLKKKKEKKEKDSWPEEPWERGGNSGFNGHDSVYNSYTSNK